MAALTWEGDVNEDGMTDYVFLFPESCGNWSECLLGVYVGCTTENQVVPVWGPEYAFDLRIASEHEAWQTTYSFDLPPGAGDTTIDGTRWLDLVRIQRTGESDQDAVSPQLLRFSGEHYTVRSE